MPSQKQDIIALKAHIHLCYKNRKGRLERCKQLLVLKVIRERDKALGMMKYDEKKIKAALTRMVIVNELPFLIF